jgi:hypothetical protein
MRAERLSPFRSGGEPGTRGDFRLDRPSAPAAACLALAALTGGWSKAGEVRSRQPGGGGLDSVGAE